MKWHTERSTYTKKPKKKTKTKKHFLRNLFPRSNWALIPKRNQSVHWFCVHHNCSEPRFIRMTSIHNYETRTRGAHFDLIFFPVDFLCCSEFVTFVAGLGAESFSVAVRIHDDDLYMAQSWLGLDVCRRNGIGWPWKRSKFIWLVLITWISKRLFMHSHSFFCTGKHTERSNAQIMEFYACKCTAAAASSTKWTITLTNCNGFCFGKLWIWPNSNARMNAKNSRENFTFSVATIFKMFLFGSWTNSIKS